MAGRLAGSRAGDSRASAPWLAWARSVLHPRFAMGLAMAALSLAILGRFGAAASHGIERAWERTVKSYDRMQVVYDVRNQLEEWSQETGGR